MLNKIILSAMIGTGSMLLPTFALASSSGDLTKDEWLGKLKVVVPEMICKNFTQNESVNKQLMESKIDYDKCVSLIPASFDKCQAKYYSNLPATINKDTAPQWGRTIGECIGTDFAVTHLISPGTPATTSSDTSAPSTNDSGTSTSDPATPPPAPPSTDTSSSSSSSSSSADSMTKDVWLGKLKAVAPELICKGFFKEESLNQRLTKLKIDYDKCLTLLPPSVEKCQTQFYSSIPSDINQELAAKWGHTIGECIGKDFAIKYLLADEPAS